MNDPIIGQRFTVKQSKGAPNVYEFIGEQPSRDPVYRYALRLVEFDQMQGTRLGIGFTMFVERAWFDVRGELAAATEGAVRAVVL